MVYLPSDGVLPYKCHSVVLCENSRRYEEQ